MPLEVPVEKITEAVLRELIANQVSEAKIIEYKQSLPGTAESERKEFLADVSSFANASGGYLVYGMKEEDGLPVELCGVDGDNPDSVVAGLDSRIRDGIRPRIPGSVVRWVPLGEGRGAVVVRIPRSFASPHMVTYKGASKFFSRHSNGKYPLDVEEIRAAFLLSGAITEKIRQFRLDRIAKIRAGEAPVPLLDSAKVVLHVIPLGAFSTMSMIDLLRVSSLTGELALTLLNHFLAGSDGRFNFEGYVRYTVSSDEGRAGSYLQIFRNGILETVDTSMLMPRDGRRSVPSVLFEEATIKTLQNYASSLIELGVDVPLAFSLTLLGVSGYVMAVDHWFARVTPTTIDPDAILVPAVLFESLDTDVSHLMKSSFDVVWNAAGWARSMCYDDNGVRRKSR